MAVRRELLERELKKLASRKSQAARGTLVTGDAGEQQEGQSPHPKAENDGQHGD